MLEAGKRLLHHNNTAFSLTVLLIPPPLDSDASDVTGQIDSEAAVSDHAVTLHRLPPVEHDSGPVHPSEYMELHARHVADAVAALAAPVAAVVVDWFGTTLLDVARELESLWHGVPMAPWPLYAEQPLNAFEIVACMGVVVGLRTCAGWGRGDGARGAEPDGRRQAGEEGQGEGARDEGRVQEGRGGGRVVVHRHAETGARYAS
jgi:hypothetical protein